MTVRLPAIDQWLETAEESNTSVALNSGRLGSASRPLLGCCGPYPSVGRTSANDANDPDRT